ncbi:hypothetical protein [Pseudomonas sp. NFIX28]|jgi:hypothetical protein|uniref:hypothetical protein n=1 Tax=Pseudomonas sp. NFIX28 TaxID=1566235 RepID=UPI000896B9BE|nr:hypothetical protein [Pseudomonas sp. NFIX28]SDZ62649.1 hypothetical protein SAMN03159453_05194 [Pseudomonas sp. NFIX28]
MKTLSLPATALLLGSLLPLVGHAETPAATPGEGCVEVSVGGYKAPDYGCLSQQMGNNPDAAKAAQQNREALQVPIHKRPPNQMGLATPAATSTRMGNTFGTSVKPQRP